MVWKTAKADEKLALVRDINRVEPAYKFTPEDSVVETLDLPFYPGGRLVSLARGKGRALCYISLPGGMIMLDGSTANIHHANAAAPLQLSAQTIADYLKFHLYFTRQGWLEGVLATETGGGFNATARIAAPDGLGEVQLAVSMRGEVTLGARNKIGAGKPLPDKFTF